MSTHADAVGRHGLVAGSYVWVGLGLAGDIDAGAAAGIVAAGLGGALGIGLGVGLGIGGVAPVEVPAFAAIIAVVARAAVAIMIVATARPTFPRRNRISSR
jgi:hypothetical protein